MDERHPHPKNETSEYEAAFDRVSGRSGEHVSRLLREIDEAMALLSDLLARPESERRGLAETEVRFHALGLCELLFAKTRDAWFDDPARAVELAEIAVVVAGRLDTSRYRTALVEDTQARAFAHLGNAYRVVSDLRQAEEALTKAEEHHRQSEDAYTEAEILVFKASLRTSQGRFDEAIDLLDCAIPIYREAKDRHQEGKALIKKGTAHGHAGRFKESIRLIRSGLSRIDLLEEPRLQVTARHNLLWFLTDSGRHEEAQKDLEKTRRLYLELGEPTNLVRLRWLEGRIAREMGRLEEAEAALREARDAFTGRGIAFDAALVSLDLAMVYARRGESAALKQLAAEMLPIFESRDVHQEALAALLIFRQAADAEEVTVGLLDQIASYLQRARSNPELRFSIET